MMTNTTRARLRTKTGCLPCRRQRKKCDERHPSCTACRTALRECEWPLEKDLIDRRFITGGRLRTAAVGKDKPIATTRDLSLFNNKTSRCLADNKQTYVPSLLTLISESAAAHGIVARDLELALSNHFSQSYFYLLILPDSHCDFHNGWLAEIQELMVSHKSLYYSVLACAASHAHFTDASPRMQDMALNYYTRALGELSGLLNKVSRLENHNGLLMSVILLYLHGCMGSGSYSDIPEHLRAAMRIVDLRLLGDNAGAKCLFDRLAVESVLYQIFLVTTGLWSKPRELQFHFDPYFWARAEKLLERSDLFPGYPKSFNSPVLGVPTRLFGLIIQLSQACLGKSTLSTKDLSQGRRVIEEWEANFQTADDLRKHRDTDEDSGLQETAYRDAESLFVLVTSIMLDYLVLRGCGAGLPRAEAQSSWQVREALRVLHVHRGDDKWAISYLASWPVYALGFFLDEAEERDVIRKDLEQRWNLTKFTQAKRFLNDLEQEWLNRDSRLLLDSTSLHTEG